MKNKLCETITNKENFDLPTSVVGRILKDYSSLTDQSYLMSFDCYSVNRIGSMFVGRLYVRVFHKDKDAIPEHKFLPACKALETETYIGKIPKVAAYKNLRLVRRV